MSRLIKSSLLVALVGFAASASALEILGAKVLGSGQQAVLEMDVTYGGGCKEHSFELQLQGCFETFPVKCEANLVDLTVDDFCEALISKTVTFTLRELGLLDSYFERGSLKISAPSGQPVTVRLP
jgi:hypothetical protein